MRAGPLSDKRVIQVLNDGFINTWVLKPTLPGLRDKAAADARQLAKAVLDARQKGSPVDCVVLSPNLKLVAVRPLHDLFDDRSEGDLPSRYRKFLTEALEKARK